MLDNPWLPALLWVLLFYCDYYLSLWGARLRNAQTSYEYEGSYEPTPRLEKDVDSQKWLSWMVSLWIVFGAAFLLATGYVKPHPPFLYGIVIGLFLVFQLGSVVIHIDSILFFRRLASPRPGLEGHIRLTREALYRMASNRFTTLAVFTISCFILTNSVILLGGSVSLLVTALRYVRQANYQKELAEESVKGE